MTTTTLSTWASTYGVGRRHVDFSVRSSTPTTGAMTDRDAQGQWRVVRGGTIIHRENKILDFQWLGLNGDIVYARAIDAAGNAGDWESYTYVVAANTAADFVAYVDTSGNDTTGDGSEENPWATVTKAVTEAQSALTSGQVGVIFLSDDQTWAHTATLYSGGDATSRLVRFVRKGGGTNRPILTFSNGVTAFTAGKRGTFHVDGVDLDGAHTSGSGYAFNLVRSGGVAADRSDYNVMVVDCDVSDFGYGCLANNGLTSADRDTQGNDFIAFQNVTFSGLREYAIYGFFFTNHTMFRQVTFDPHATAFNNPWRTWSLGRCYGEDITFDTNDSGGMRLMWGAASSDDDALRLCTFVRVTMYGTSSSNNINLGPDTGVAGLGIVRDVRFVDCTLYRANWTVPATVGAANMAECERLDFLECACFGSGSWIFQVDATAAGQHKSIRFRNCTHILGDYSNWFAQFNGAASQYADDCIQMHGCWRYCSVDSSGGSNAFIWAASMTRAELATKVSASDYNHYGGVSGRSLVWSRTSDFTSGTLADWRTASGMDANSSITQNTTFDLTAAGTAPAHLLADIHLATGTGPLAGTGYPLPLGVSIDADGYLRSATTPDAGPYEYGATDTPEDPEIGGGGGGTAILRTGLRLGLRLGL